MRILSLIFLSLPILACGKSGGTGGATTSPGAANFQLVCDSSDTKERSSLFCVRIDSRNGDVQVVAVDKLPVSQGPTAAEARDPGTYQLECHATRNEATSDLFCLRLNRASGEMLLVALPKVGMVPSDSK
jgi:hypothetical protein